jgi:hypothetical protein
MPVSIVIIGLLFVDSFSIGHALVIGKIIIKKSIKRVDIRFLIGYYQYIFDPIDKRRGGKWKL